MADPVRGSSVKLEGEDLVIRMPKDRAQSLRVALAECPCRATKSNATQNIRSGLSMAIGRAISPKPVQRNPLYKTED
ncbi:hypothetical protein P5P81_03385 [Tritonibacter mobilis]|nr:hypothetical protein [Tritonibacter mobilis]